MFRIPTGVTAACLLVLLAVGCAGCDKGTAAQDVSNGKRGKEDANPAPREVALAFAKAVRAGDLPAAKDASFGSDKGYRALQVLSDTWNSLEAYVAAIEAAEPSTRGRLTHFRRQYDLPDDLDAQARAADEKIEGDLAVVSGGENDPEPILLKKVNGAWKVDLEATLQKKRLVTDKDVAYWRQLGLQFKKIAERIRSGKRSVEGLLEGL